MGTQQSTLSRQKGNTKNQGKQVSKQYQNCYNKAKSNPSYLKSLFNECPKFTNNLMKIFPEALSSYEHFHDVATYLRKYQPIDNCHQIAKNNIGQTTILDRFFMICLNIRQHTDYAGKQLSVSEATSLFETYMQLFMPNPKIQNMDKILSFIHMPQNQSLNAKQFSTKLREYFPHIQKYITDYIKFKMRDCIEDGHVLKLFKSKILTEDAILLALKISEISGKEIVQLYSTESHGLSFHSIQKKLIGYTGHWLLLIEHSQKNEQGQKQVYKFGAFQNGPIRDVNAHQGDLTGFLFSIDPKIRFMTTDKGDNSSHYFYINNIDEKLSKMRKGIGFGGNKYKEEFKLWIDEDIDRSTVFNGNDPTYGFGTLANHGTEKLNIRVMEIWGLGSSTDIQNQNDYWKERQQEIMKRRKVNKKQLIDGNANMVFEKTFAHRDQVYGTIEKKEEKEDN